MFATNWWIHGNQFYHRHLCQSESMPIPIPYQTSNSPYRSRANEAHREKSILNKRGRQLCESQDRYDVQPTILVEIVFVEHQFGHRSRSTTKGETGRSQCWPLTSSIDRMHCFVDWTERATDAGYCTRSLLFFLFFFFFFLGILISCTMQWLVNIVQLIRVNNRTKGENLYGSFVQSHSTYELTSW